MGFSRQEYSGGLPFSSPGDLPDPWIEPASLIYPALADRFFTTSAIWKSATLPSVTHLQIFYFGYFHVLRPLSE